MSRIMTAGGHVSKLSDWRFEPEPALTVSMLATNGKFASVSFLAVRRKLHR